MPITFNSYFNKVYVVSLDDKDKNFKEVSVQLQHNDINHEKFIAIDGRGTPAEKEMKRKEFNKMYKLKIPKDANIPAMSLTIGNILMYREMIKNNWERILILEDDVVLDDNIIKIFSDGINSINKVKWDLLYLGCGGECGDKGVSSIKSKNNNHLSTWLSNKEWNPDMTKTGKLWVKHPFDIRFPCNIKRCKPISKYMSVNKGVGGTFGYAISREGAIKMLDYIGKDVNNHIDQYLILAVKDKVVKSINFNPPIVWHKFGMIVAGASTIEWN